MSSITRKEEVIMTLLLEHSEMYGLDMVNSSSEIKRGTVYVTLGRMEDKGLISSKERKPPKGSRGPSRRVYKLTGAGQRAIKAWKQYRSSIGLQF